MVNIQHVIMKDTAQPAKLCMSIGTKGGLIGHNLTDWNRLPQ